MVVGIAVLCAVPFFIREYYVGVATELLIFIILALSFRLMLTTGGWNLAHYVMMGAGAYFSAIMVKDFGWPFWATLPVAGLVTALVGLVLSYPLARMREFAYLIGSYAMGEAIRLSWNKLDHPFGGVGGITDIPRPSSWSIPGLPTIDFRQAISYYFLVVVVMPVSMFIGTVFFVLLAEGLRPLGAWRPLVYGSVLIGVLLFMPLGLEGLPARVSPWVKRLRRRIRGE